MVTIMIIIIYDDNNYNNDINIGKNNNTNNVGLT